MGSTEEDTTTSKSTSLYDAASSTEPLLFKPTTSSAYPSPPIEEPPQSDPSESDPTQSLQISFNYGPRPFKDLPFLILFLLFVLCTFAFGIFSIFHRNDNYSNVSAFTYDSNSTSCVQATSFLSSQIWVSETSFFALSSSSLWTYLVWTLVITSVLSVPICLLLLLLLKHYTKQIVYVLLPFFIIMPVFFDVYWFNGKIVAKESNGEYTCVWKQDSWVPAYFALAILTMLWSLTGMVEAQVYVTSGTIAQWYFSKDDTKPHRSIRRSLRNAFGPSSGTICLSGLLVFVVRVVRAAVDSAREEDVPGIVNLVLRCCVNALLSAIDFLNKFTINFAAITGEAYCTSARMTYELLRRNLLSAVFVETVSTRLLAGVIFVLSAVYAIAVCAILKGVSDLGVNMYTVAALAWVLLILVLGFFVHVLDNVIDTVYICYAIDRDRGEVYKHEVHDVYVQLPISRNSRSSYPSRTLDV
ncbi:hypothetical protein V6Z11_A01G186000 [Gossypium hirsutum]